MEPVRSPSLVSDAHLRAIGAIIVNWSAIDTQMEIAILGLYKINPDRGMVLTSNISFANRLTLLRILAMRGAIEDVNLAEECKTILNRIESTYGLRNAAAHGVWGKGDTPTTAKRMAIRVKGNRLRTINEQVTAEELEATAPQILKLKIDFSDLLVQLQLVPANSPSYA